MLSSFVVVLNQWVDTIGGPRLGSFRERVHFESLCATVYSHHVSDSDDNRSFPARLLRLLPPESYSYMEE